MSVARPVVRCAAVRFAVVRFAVGLTGGALLCVALAAVTPGVAGASIGESVRTSYDRPDHRTAPWDGWAMHPRRGRASVDTKLPERSGAGRRVVYGVTAQRVWVVGARGHVVRSYLVSGKLDRPGPGRYRVYSRSRHALSYVGSARMQYMIRFAHGRRAAIGFHSIPVGPGGHRVQAVGDLGRPLSAGCVRQRLSDARFLWRWANAGTRVVVVR